MSFTITAANGLPAAAAKFLVGMVAPFSANVAPAGYIAASGQLISRSTYSLLWAFAQASGNIAASDGAWTQGQYSPGDGSTTFRIPDYRGEFPRFWDNGKGTDAGRAIGAQQAQDLQPHTHGGGVSGLYTVNGGASTNVFQGTANTGSTGTTETRPRNIAVLGCIFTGV